MRINLLNSQSIFRPQMQNPMQSAMGQLQRVFQQANANYVGNKNCSNKNYDTVELSKKALDMLDELDAQSEPDQMAILGYQKYPPMSKAKWAENSILAQRDGVKTISDRVDYEKSKLQFTMSKIEELENYLNGTGTHSDPNMTKDLAETYLYNYKQSITLDFTFDINRHINQCRSYVDEYDALSGGRASEVTENLLNFISAESLGLSNLSDDPQEIMNALENASKILDGINRQVEDAYAQLTGSRHFTEPARSYSFFRGNSPMDFFASQMERSYKIMDMDEWWVDTSWENAELIDTSQMKFTGQILDLLDTE